MSRKIGKQKEKNKLSCDKIILLFALALAIFGAIMIFDASVYVANSEKNNPFYYLTHQLIWLLFGGLFGFIFYKIDYRKLLKFSLPIYIITIILLVAVLFLAKDINGAKRWFSIGSLPPIQPAEFAKLFVIFYLSTWISKNSYFTKQKSDEDFKKSFIKNIISFGVILSLIALPILLEPDLGTTLMILATSFCMFLIAKEDNRHYIYNLGLLLLSAPLVLITIAIEPYRLKRFSTYLNLMLTGEVADPQATGYQMQQILIGIGSGGLLGTGFGQSRQRFGYLVENTAFTDSIFAVVLEEIGWLGGIMLITAWLLFFWRGLRIANKAPDKEGKLLATGITIWLTLQTFMNMAANLGIIPLTGIPAPLLTYGGSSTIITIIAIAILLNISKYCTNERKS